ncbi:DUF4233 domain-containing protein [Marisediminicola antarctica]|uniref:DUF4233 domain-containing protein n=1 Tax=Marisediminicola antarctica TaxID=674079 RepID=UPI00137B2762|nr:DUF4233 domain-containing protein [Marisediminicola antarctica]
MSPRERRAPRRRSATESLLSIVLVLEALLVFFLTLVVFALDALPPAAAFIGGGVLFVALLALGRVMRYEWAVWVGWLMQLVIILTGLLEPLMFGIGAIFVALWTYCFITGRRLDKRNAALFPDDSTDTSTTDTKETP